MFEKGERVGGVWQHNTYPGAACDVPSHLYEFSFAPNRWSRRYAPQAEIQAYLEGVARRFGVLDRIRTGVEVKSAAWDEERGQLDARDQRRLARGRGPAHRLRSALGPEDAADLRAWRASPAPPSTPPNGATTSTWPASASPWSAPAAARSRSCRRSSPKSPSSTSTSARPAGPFPRMDFAYSGLGAAALRALPARAAPRSRLPLRLPRVRRGGDDAPPLAAAGPARRRPAPDRGGDRGSRAAPQGHPDRRDRLQAGDAHRRLVSGPDRSPTSSWSPSGSTR